MFENCFKNRISKICLVIFITILELGSLGAIIYSIYNRAFYIEDIQSQYVLSNVTIVERELISIEPNIVISLKYQINKIHFNKTISAYFVTTNGSFIYSLEQDKSYLIWIEMDSPINFQAEKPTDSETFNLYYFIWFSLIITIIFIVLVYIQWYMFYRHLYPIRINPQQIYI